MPTAQRKGARLFLRIFWLILLPVFSTAQEPAPPQHRLSEDLQVIRLTPDIWRFVSYQDMGGDWGRVPANGPPGSCPATAPPAARTLSGAPWS